MSAGGYLGDSMLELEKTEVYYNDSCSQTCMPGDALVDMEPSTIDNVRSGAALGLLFWPDNFIFTGNNGTKGHDKGV